MAKKSSRRASKTTSQSARSGPSLAQKLTGLTSSVWPVKHKLDWSPQALQKVLRTSRSQQAQKPASQPKGLKKPSKPFYGVQATQVATPPLKTACAAVAARREVLFATRKTGAGNAPPKTFRNVRCK